MREINMKLLLMVVLLKYYGRKISICALSSLLLSIWPKKLDFYHEKLWKCYKNSKKSFLQPLNITAKIHLLLSLSQMHKSFMTRHNKIEIMMKKILFQIEKHIVCLLFISKKIFLHFNVFKNCNLSFWEENLTVSQTKLISQKIINIIFRKKV